MRRVSASNKICDLLRDITDAVTAGDRLVHEAMLLEAVRELGRMERTTGVHRRRLLNAAIDAQTDGYFYAALDAALEDDAWSSVDVTVKRMRRGREDWGTCVEGIAGLAELLSRVPHSSDREKRALHTVQVGVAPPNPRRHRVDA